jgi:hypothetical protein
VFYSLVKNFSFSRPVSKNVETKLYTLNISLLFVCGLPKHTLNRLKLNSSNIQSISGKQIENKMVQLIKNIISVSLQAEI